MPRSCSHLLFLGFLVTLVCFALGACDRSPSPASSPQHSALSTQNSAHRIACLSPAVAITLKDLGLESSIIARHGYDLALSPSLPVAGDQQGLNYETLLTLNPTHVLLQMGSGTPAKLTTLAKEHNWAVTNYSILTLDDIQRTTRELHATFAPPGSPCPLLDRMTAVWSAPPDPAFARAGRIVLLASISPPAALGPGSFHHQILERLGATPAITQGNPFIELDAESLLALKPDGIILILPRGRDDALPPPASPAQMSSQLRTRLGALGKLSLPALDTTAHPERLALIDDPLAHTPSSAMLGVTEEMRSILTNWSVDAAAQQRHAPTPLNPK
jgi:ABC-type hemin transport system substrate-binding protein